MVDAHRCKAIEGDVRDECREGFAYGIECAVEIEMLGIDIRDHGDGRREFDEGAVGLIGLDDHPLAFAQPRVGAVGVDDAAVDDGGIAVGGIEHGRDQ